ncbi:MAG: acyl carrier protein [Acidimicrobiales bacterium]
MDRQTAFATFQRTVAEVLDIDPALVVPEANWGRDLDADSLSVLEITLALSDAFDIKIPDVEPEEIATAGQAFEVVWGLLPG